MTSNGFRPRESGWGGDPARGVERRALLALYRNHPATAPGDRYNWKARGEASRNRDMLLAWAATQPDDVLLSCRNLGPVALRWIREHAAPEPPTIDCLCGDVFPSVVAFHEHVHLSHPEADHPEPRSAEPEGLDAAYRERNAVVAALIRVGGYRAWRMLAPDAEGWWLVYAETPEGQVSWHVSSVDIRLFDDVPVGTEPWDGHTTDEKYERVARLRGEQMTRPWIHPRLGVAALAETSAPEPRAADPESHVLDGSCCRPAEPEGLDAAWAEAEAALPEGWGVQVIPGQPEAWEASPVRDIPNRRLDRSGHGPTPAAALRALAARLREDDR